MSFKNSKKYYYSVFLYRNKEKTEFNSKLIKLNT